MPIAENITWSDEWGGSLRLTVDGHPARIPTDKDWWVKKGYVVIIFNDPEIDMAGILPTVGFPPEKPHIKLDNCVKNARLVQLWKELMAALESPDPNAFEPGRVVEPGPIELKT